MQSIEYLMKNATLVELKTFPPHEGNKKLLYRDRDGNVDVLTHLRSPIDINIKIIFSNNLIHPQPDSKNYIFEQFIKANESTKICCGPIFIIHCIFTKIWIESDEHTDLSFYLVKDLHLNQSSLNILNKDKKY